MSATQYDNELRGALFKNNKKAQEADPTRREKMPDYRGEVTVHGEEFWLSAWLEKSQKGETYMKLSLQSKSGRTTAGAAPTGAGSVPPPPPDEDDIPF